MARICINTRDELIIIDLSKVAFMRADGNYTNVMYIDGQTVVLSLGLSKVEGLVGQAYPKGTKSPFVRMGRSMIINQSYLNRINILKQKLYLYDYENHIYSLTVPKPLLKEYREIIRKQYKAENE